MNDFDIIVGTVDDSGIVYAEKVKSHRSLKARGHGWRYNELTHTVYWHENHPSEYEANVKSWLEKEGYSTKYQVTLEDISDKDLYIKLWNNAHGLYEQISKSSNSKVLLETKSVLLELITEIMFGHRFKISIDKKIYPALICKNVAYKARGEHEYRITWFNPETMQPFNHIDFGSETLNYILHYKKFPMGISIKYFKMGLSTPKIIVEKL